MGNLRSEWSRPQAVRLNENYKRGCQKIEALTLRMRTRFRSSSARVFARVFARVSGQTAQCFTHPLNLPFAGCLRVTINFPKKGGPSMCDQFGSEKKYFFDRSFFKKIFFRLKKSKNRVGKKKFAKRSGKCGALPVVAKWPLQSAQRDLIQILFPIGAAWVGPITYILPQCKKVELAWGERG